MHTQAFPGQPPKVNVQAEDRVYLRDETGHRMLDGLGGLWSVSLGYNEERIVEAAARQLRKLPYSHSFWNQGHEAGYILAEELQAALPFPVEKVGFTGGGSDANDTAVKLAWYYNNALGKPNKKKVLARGKAYHGVTAIAASCSGLPGLHAGFGAKEGNKLPLEGFVHLTCPHMYRFGKQNETEDEFAIRLAQELEATILKEGADSIAAFIAEPLMGAGGVMPAPRGYFERVQAILKKHDILFIADEVVCGFGRLGHDFGCEAYGIQPDMMTLAKAITSSYAPMGAIAISPEVAEVIAQGSHSSLVGHGYTFGAHPLACAIASECLKIYKGDKVLDNVRSRSKELLEGLAKVGENSPIVGEARGRGLIAAIELIASRSTREPFAPADGVGAFFVERARHHGLIVRGVGETIACSPPLVINKEQVSELLEGYAKALKDTEEMVSSKGLLKDSAETPLFTTSLQLD